MPRYIPTAIIALSALTAMAQTEKTDTIMSAYSPSRTVITESPAGLKITILQHSGDSLVENVYVQPYSPNASVKSDQYTHTGFETTFTEGTLGVKIKKRHWEMVTGGLCLGFVYPYGQPADLGLQWNKSLEISWINALAIRYRTKLLSVSLGFGFDWRNYKITTSGHGLGINNEGGITTRHYPDYTHSQSSRIKVFSLGLPLLYTQKIPKTTLSVTVGGILNFNTHASLKSWYINSDGNHVEEYAENFHHRRITFDLFGSINLYKGCGLYLRYSPQSVLQGHGSPQFTPLSAGLMLFL